jgi:hypothetical protein
VPQAADCPKIMIMRFYTKINSFLGFIAAGLLSLFGKSPPKPVADDLKRADFKTSTQNLGIRFSDKIRNVFRFKWLKAADRADAGRDYHSEGSK